MLITFGNKNRPDDIYLEMFLSNFFVKGYNFQVQGNSILWYYVFQIAKIIMTFAVFITRLEFQNSVWLRQVAGSVLYRLEFVEAKHWLGAFSVADMVAWLLNFFRESPTSNLQMKFKATQNISLSRMCIYFFVLTII